MNTITLNTRVIAKTRQALAEEIFHFEMGVWLSKPEPFHNICHTAGCVAGHIALVASEGDIVSTILHGDGPSIEIMAVDSAINEEVRNPWTFDSLASLSQLFVGEYPTERLLADITRKNAIFRLDYWVRDFFPDQWEEYKAMVRQLRKRGVKDDILDRLA